MLSSADPAGGLSESWWLGINYLLTFVIGYVWPHVYAVCTCVMNLSAATPFDWQII